MNKFWMVYRMPSNRPGDGEEPSGMLAQELSVSNYIKAVRH